MRSETPLTYFSSCGRAKSIFQALLCVWAGGLITRWWWTDQMHKKRNLLDRREYQHRLTSQQLFPPSWSSERCSAKLSGEVHTQRDVGAAVLNAELCVGAGGESKSQILLTGNHYLPPSGHLVFTCVYVCLLVCYFWGGAVCLLCLLKLPHRELSLCVRDTSRGFHKTTSWLLLLWQLVKKLGCPQLLSTICKLPLW